MRSNEAYMWEDDSGTCHDVRIVKDSEVLMMFYWIKLIAALAITYE